MSWWAWVLLFVAVAAGLVWLARRQDTAAESATKSLTELEHAQHTIDVQKRQLESGANRPRSLAAVKRLLRGGRF